MNRSEAQPNAARHGRVNGVGRSFAGLGGAAGRKLAQALRSVDPDVGRHLVQLPLLSYSLFSSTRDAVRPGRADGHAPIVFVHGLGGRRGDFLPMSAYLWLNGRRRSYRIHFRRGATIREMANALAGYVRRVARATGMAKVDLVAHSLGGLVSRLALADHGLSRNVQTLVTLGSPHHGTHAARFGNTATLRELRPESRLLARLSRTPWPKAVQGITFWSQNDLMIVPAQSALVTGMKAIEMTPFTHYSYLIDPRSWSAVNAALCESAGRP